LFRIIFLTGLVLLVACQARGVVQPTNVSEAGAKIPPTAAPTKPSPTKTAPPAATATIAVEEPAAAAGKTISASILLDPALAGDPDSAMISQYLYEGLVRLNASGQPEPALAASWVISDDGLSYIFTLRPNVRFSDGSAITTDMIETNFNRWFDRTHPLRGSGSYKAWERVFLGFRGDKTSDERTKSLIDGIQKVDQFSVLIHLSRPAPELLTYLADPAFAILKTDALAGGKYGLRETPVISSGPYLVESWTNKELKLSPNPNYWGKVPTESLTYNLR
jgi:peptide/nickel transport system substrate-binding protein